MFQRVCQLGVCLTTMVILAGCGGSADDRPQPVPATATVTLSGSPVEGATVTFSPTAEGAPAYGKTDAEGNVVLTTYENGDGAVPGSYQVMVSKMEAVGGAAAEDNEDDESDEDTVFKSLVPNKYRGISTTDLTAEVTEDGENTFTFTLTK